MPQSYKPTTHKFVAVLHKNISSGQIMNALAHATAGLVGNTKDLNSMRLNAYLDKDRTVHPAISDNPFIILRADNSNKLRSLRSALMAEDIEYTDFTSAMTIGTYAEQHERMNNTSESELEYWAIVFFGEAKKASELTRKFSLWKD